MQFSLMNNTPVHFIFGIIMVIIFIITTFKLKGPQKKLGLRAMHIVFVPVFLSGAYIWTIVPFSIPLLIKSVAASIAFFFMTKIAKDPSDLTNWVVCGTLISIGGTLAVTMI